MNEEREMTESLPPLRSNEMFGRPGDGRLAPRGAMPRVPFTAIRLGGDFRFLGERFTKVSFSVARFQKDQTMWTNFGDTLVVPLD